jgi:preprotein translocase subunit SecD
VFFLGLGAVFGLVALTGVWKPELGLDLQGGTRITLTAEGDNVTPESLEQAREIIDSRVNGSGVSEAEVTSSNNRYIVVEIPGASRADLVNTVKRQAQLRFRVVAMVAPGTATGSEAPGDSSSPGSGVLLPSDSASPSATKGDSASPGARGPAKASHAKRATEPSDSASASPSADPSASPEPGAGSADVDDPLKWAENPDQAWVTKFNKYTCPPAGESTNVVDDPAKPLITCDEDGNKYLLSVAMIEGTQLAGADAGAPDQASVEWVVQLDFDSEGTKTFADISRALYGTDRQFAIVLDGQVLSAPTMEGVITNGQAEISGSFTEATASSLATSLKFGALPIAFEEPTVETVGPSLAGNQLSAGITAGLLGLLLVMIYCLIYYRGLGIVVIASLFVAAALTYGLVLLLSETANFTLSLPGIAGLIVAVGITADSFIVYFERIRDEMRDGKSMRVAVEAGWKRARNTCLAADTVSLLAAVVLYIFAAGAVKGFAFALGLSTLIDLVVFFWFTHPMVSWLARFSFYNKGHKRSGLDAEALGIDRLPAGGVA